MKLAAPRKSNGSGIEVRFRLDGVAQSGVPTTVAIGFAGVSPHGGASVRFAADAGLLIPAAYTISAPLPEDAADRAIAVPVTPTAEGLAYLHVFTTQRGATSVSSIAIQTGLPAVSKPRLDVQATPDGESVRVIPVP